MKSPYAILSAATLIQVATAVQWAEPSVTPVGGSVGGMGFSPIPTEAPGLLIGGIRIPKELRRRQDFPDNWCGYVGGNVDDVLSCGAAYTCVHSGTAVGCCTGLISLCTALYTSCANFNDACGSSCSSNTKILKCSGIGSSYCAKYTFASGLVNYNCNSQSGIVSSVAFLSDVGTGTATFSLTFATSRFSTSASSAGSSTGSSASPTSTSDIFNFTNTPSSRKKSVGSGAIAGIVVGAIAVIGLIGGLAAFFLLRKKPKPSPPAPIDPTPPMQQQPQQYQAPPAPGAYAQQQYGQPQQGPYFAGGQPIPAGASYYDSKGPQPVDVPPQYQPNNLSPQPPQQEYTAFNPAVAGGVSQPRDSMAKPPAVPEISGTEVAGGPSRVTSPVSAIGAGQTGNKQGYEVGPTAGPVYEMGEGMHR